MATLADLVSPPVDLQGRVHAALNHVLVVLRNGRPVKIVAPGKRYGSGFRVGPVGHLQALQISLAPVTLRVLVRDVPLRRRQDGTQFHLPEVRLNVQVRINPDAAVLDAALTRRGLGFAEALHDEVVDELTALVLEEFGDLEHEEVWGRSLTGSFAHVQDLLGRAVLVDGISSVQVTPDPRYREMLDAQAEAERDLLRLEQEQRVQQQTVLNEGQLGRLGAQVEASVFAAKVEALSQVASTHSLNLQHLLYPELQTLESQQRHEVIMALLADPGLLRRNTGLEAALMAHLAQLSTPTVLAQPDQHGPSVRVIPHQPGPALSESLGTPALRPLDDRLAGVWSSSGRDPERLVGLGAARSGDRGLVLAVVHEGEPRREPFGAARTVVAEDVELLQVPFRPLLRELVEVTMEQGLPHLPPGAVRWEPVVEGNRLRLNIASDSVRPSRVKRELIAPGALLLPALAAVLPYAGIDPVLQAD